MNLISIDPGSIKCGIAVFHNRSLIYHDVLISKYKTLNIRLHDICDKIETLLYKYNINLILIEEVFVGNNSRTAISMGKTLGFILRSCKGIEIELVNAVSARAKLFITTQYRKFKDRKKIKTYIQRFVYILFGEYISEDASDAIINGLSYLKSSKEQK